MVCSKPAGEHQALEMQYLMYLFTILFVKNNALIPENML
jgi:hypothetical protein